MPWGNLRYIEKRGIYGYLTPEGKKRYFGTRQEATEPEHVEAKTDQIATENQNEEEE